MSELSAPPNRRSFASHRIRKAIEFRRVYDSGSKIQTPYFVAFCLRHPAPDTGEPFRAAGPRIGFTIPRGVGKAVVRNRIRRRLRELMRARLSRMEPDWDVVFNPRRSAFHAPLPALERELDKVVAQCSA